MIDIFTDGSAVVKEGENYQKGGFGIVFMINGEVKKTVSRGFRPTKTGRMELMAVFTALKILDKDQKATFYCDSQYVIHCFTKNWMKHWQDEGWPDRIKNKDIIIPMFEEYKKFPKFNIKFEHVKGHSGVYGNELCDSLASYKNFTVFELDMVD